MTDERFRAFDAIQPPDQWDDITQRPVPLAPAGALERARPAGPALVAAALAAVVVLAAIAIVHDRRGGQTVRSAGAPVESLAVSPARPSDWMVDGTAGGPNPLPPGVARCRIGADLLTTGAAATPFATISIPAIGLKDVSILEGTDAQTLTKGVGHYPDSPQPGRAGNVALAGHRTTYGAPFHDLDQVAAGDEIVIESGSDRVVYRVRSTKVTAPTDTSVLAATDDDRLTLTTPTPKYSNEQRLVVVAGLVGTPCTPVPTASVPGQGSAGVEVPAATLATCRLGETGATGVFVTGTFTPADPDRTSATVRVDVVGPTGAVLGLARVTVHLADGAGEPFQLTVPITGDTTGAVCRIGKIVGG